MAGLTDDEKKRLAAEAMVIIMPIAEKYELDTSLGARSALFEAFQAGIKFAINDIQKMAGEVDHGTE